jgi:DNA-binding response OmpR family regulator
LDILLPKKNGLEVVQALRTQGIKTPVLMLTARTATEDIVQGLDRGADDYLTKPFVFSEFLARVRSLVRRAAESTTTLTVGDLHLDALTRKAIRNEQSIALTAREFALLEYLMRRVGQVVTRQEIAKEIWGYDFDPGTNVVDVYINHLRKKIDSGTAHKYLRTMRGKGYIFTDIEGPSHTK